MDFKHLVVSIFVAVLFGLVRSQTDQEISNTLNENLPPELQGKFNESDIEGLKNKSEAVFKEKCDKNGGPEAFTNAQKAYEVFPKCVKESFGLEDPSVLQKEIELGKHNGTVDEVFKKYCARTPEAKKCFNVLSESVKPCFSAEEQKHMKTLYNITEQLAEFICYKDGDRIALFIAEGGPECFTDRQDAIQQCVNETLGGDIKFDPNNITASAIPQIAFGAKECKQLSDLQLCVVKALEACKAPTSANIVEALFKFARQATPCNTEVNKPNSASTIYATTAAVALTAFAILY